jgi:hypothetical protein
MKGVTSVASDFVLAGIEDIRPTISLFLDYTWLTPKEYGSCIAVYTCLL